ncbi:MAG: MlaC/ttg2D family ABC transporter substrate-binding protein [Geminicoccaceae bacterium]
MAAGNAADDAVRVVHALAEDIWSSRQQAEGRKRQLADAIKAKTSVGLLSRLVLGKHWRSLERVDQDEYRALFSQVVIGGLASRLDLLLREFEGPLDQHFSITGSGATGKKDVLVRSKVVATDGRALAVDWRLRATDAEPVIIDLIVEGVSLLVSQRSEFASVIERSRMDGLMNSLRKRAQSGDF